MIHLPQAYRLSSVKEAYTFGQPGFLQRIVCTFYHKLPIIELPIIVHVLILIGIRAQIDSALISRNMFYPEVEMNVNFATFLSLGHFLERLINVGPSNFDHFEILHIFHITTLHDH